MCKALIQHLTLDHVDVSGVDGGCQHLDVDIAVPQLGHLQILQPGQGDTKEKRALTPQENGINTSLVMPSVLWLKLGSACITHTPPLN